MAHDPRIMSPAEKIERGTKRVEAQRDALRDALRPIANVDMSVYLRDPRDSSPFIASEHATHLLAQIVHDAREALASLEVES